MQQLAGGVPTKAFSGKNNKETKGRPSIGAEKQGGRVHCSHGEGFTKEDVDRGVIETAKSDNGGRGKGGADRG